MFANSVALDIFSLITGIASFIAIFIFAILLIVAPIKTWFWCKDTCNEVRRLSSTERDELERLRHLERGINALIQENETLIKVVAQIAINQETLLAYMAQQNPNVHLAGMNDIVDVQSLARRESTAQKAASASKIKIAKH